MNFKLNNFINLLKRIPLVLKIKRMVYRLTVLRHSKQSFIEQLAPGSRILDVGCGNNSPFFTKELAPKCHYTGIDVGDYNQTMPNAADKYIVTTPDRFASTIEEIDGKYDAVVSAHNLEHCFERERVLAAMLNAVRPGGYIYLSFPCEESVVFPSRQGTLNYFDDPTHQAPPPDYSAILEEITATGFEIIFSTPKYKPAIHWFVGWVRENITRSTQCATYTTWTYYGFESVIWAKRYR
jgi:SAM-dependent methyltransferase